MRTLACTLAMLALCASAQGADPSGYAQWVAESRQRWADSPYGLMLARILPPSFSLENLPEPASTGAELLVRYCVQCHHLPNPAMHHAAKWPTIVERMVLRMRGRGNMGTLMTDMMAGVRAPSDEQAGILMAYLRKHAQRALDPRRVTDLDSPAAEPFRLACAQCHVLPDPQRYSAAQWPAVVARMARNMEWMNRVVGAQPVAGEPQLRIEDINAYLARHARPAHAR